MTLTPTAQPRPQRARLGSELRRLRKLAGLSGRAIAKEVGIGQASVSRVENADQVLSLPEAMKWADAVDASEDRRATLAALTEAALNEVETWRTRQRTEGLVALQADAAQLEVATRTRRTFQPTIVPGLLQTPAYARQVFELTDVVGGGDYDGAVNARTQRQQILYDQQRQFEFVLTEGALRWHPGPPATTIAQLDRITTLASLTNVEIAIIPRDAPIRAIPWIGFHLHEDIDGGIPPLVTLETPHARITVSDPAHVEIYRQQLTRLREAALSGDQAITLLSSLIAEARSALGDQERTEDPP